MKAFIVSAGLGTRLRPLTDTVPKCMIDIGGRPLLWYHVSQLKHFGITDIWINTHWLADQVTSYFGDGSKFGVKIFYSHEPELLGTSGAMKNPDSQILSAFEKEKEFIIMYGDNFTNIDYSKFIRYHRQKKSFMTIAALPDPEPWTKGVIETDPNMKITRLVEKPPKDQIKSNLSNAAAYICSSDVLNCIPPGFSDFAKDIIPQLLDAKLDLYCYLLPDYLQDTGTPERYAKAQSDLKTLKFPFSL